MKPLEPNAVLSQVVTAIDNLKVHEPIKDATNVAILDAIAAKKPSPKPLIPKKYCQYPHPPNMDDFNLSEGLGSVSLKPALDSLNNFKRQAIDAIKTKIQAMGPEASKDSKLAIGAVELIKNITEAAKCFTQTAKNINDTVNAYISGMNLMIAQITDTLSQLQQDIDQGKRMFNSDALASELISELGPELLAALNRVTGSTGVLDILAALNELSNVLSDAEKEVRMLGGTRKRIKMQLEANIALLRNAIDEFLRYTKLRKSLERSVALASTYFVDADSFLDDVPYLSVNGETSVQAIENAGFNWSLTNSGRLTNFNIFDSKSIMPRLNEMVKNFNADTQPFVVASSDIPGIIVVPEDCPGLIQCGIDPGCGPSVSIIMELYINDGATIIRSEARGFPSENVMEIVSGKYYTKGADIIEYSGAEDLGGGSWKLLISEQSKSNSFVQGGEYNYYDPFSLVGSEDLMATFTITSINNSSVIGTWTNISGKARYNSPVTLLETPVYALDAAGLYYTVDQFGNPWKMDDAGNPVLYGDGDPYVTDTLPTGAGGIYPVKYVETIIRLKKKDMSIDPSGIPHVGEQIPARNWILQVYLSGAPTEIRNIRFSDAYGDVNYGNGSTDNYLRTFALKAHWGFIPKGI